ncbi:unnamed protein product [Ambrosiozyma monospora]|uniref:Unnamed protein product n=1 Tax=Ambrosiozyma monospora TaxID=43982 RepID=A0A9W7DGH8_AMBMO|nr:unnamed protein product [Ambrosiozyma monospora]
MNIDKNKPPNQSDPPSGTSSAILTIGGGGENSTNHPITINSTSQPSTHAPTTRARSSSLPSEHLRTIGDSTFARSSILHVSPAKPVHPPTIGTFSTINFSQSENFSSSSEPGNPSSEFDSIVDSTADKASNPGNRSSEFESIEDSITDHQRDTAAPETTATSKAEPTWADIARRPTNKTRIPSRYIKTTGEVNNPKADNREALHPEIAEKLKELHSNERKVKTALKFKINPTSNKQFPSRKEQFTALSNFKSENPSLLGFLPMLTGGSTLFVNTVGLHAENTLIKGATMEERRQHFQEEKIKLTSKLAASTFTYANNMTFQLEPIDYQNTNDIIVANVLIPGSLAPCEQWILKDILPAEQFDILVQKSPDDLAKSALSENTFYNVQIMGRAKHKSVNIPNLFPYKAAKSKARLRLDPSELSEYEPISVRIRTHLSFCRLCRSTDHPTDKCPEAKVCGRCFKKGHHQIQCKTNLKHVQDIRKIEHDADNAWKSQKQQLTDRHQTAKNQKAYKQRNEARLSTEETSSK